MPVSIVFTMGETPLIVSIEDGILFLRPNRPKQYSPLSRALLDALYKALGGGAENKKIGSIRRESGSVLFDTRFSTDTYHLTQTCRRNAHDR